ncbi:MAG: hypothetical protein AB7I27_12465 [Bacteriovoracaceae bacterium]
MKIYVLFFILYSFAQSTYAKTQLIIDERGKAQITSSNDWKYEKNILGLPHVLISSEQINSTLSITLTGLKDVSLPSSELNKNQKQYQDGRKAWAASRNAEIEEFIPYQKLQIPSKAMVHTIGFKYRLNGNKYYEKSYYAECPGSLVHFKLVTLQGSKRINEADEIVKSLKCDF